MSQASGGCNSNNKRRHGVYDLAHVLYFKNVSARQSLSFICKLKLPDNFHAIQYASVKVLEMKKLKSKGKRKKEKLHTQVYLVKLGKTSVCTFCSLCVLTHQTTYIALRNMKKNTSKVQSEHTQSLHYMNIRQFFMCLNCIPPIKFPFAKLNFAVFNHVL